MIKVAIAEDHELLRASYVSLINGNEQFDLIVQAKHGKELLAKLNPEALPDVVLVDLDMPIMDGPETVLELRKKFGEDLKILALSVHEEYFLIKRMLENGTNGYVSKGA
jgi:two-component system invasion response regulator UvrY